MPLEPALKTMLDAMASQPGLALETMSAPEARAMFSAMTGAFPTTAPQIESTDTTIAGVPVRIYNADREGPTLVWLHGGGWVIGDLAFADPTCRHLADRVGIKVVSVDYRLAPEDPFPAGAEDCYAVFAAVAGSTEKVAIGGDSAGGNLSAVVAQMARDRNTTPPVLQLLVYPVIDAAMDTQSYRDNGEGYFLTASAMRWFHAQYADAATATTAYVSPIRASTLAGLAPAFVMTAEFDPLRDEGEAYATALHNAGVPATMTRYDGLIHGFISFPEVCGPTAMAAVDDAAAALKSALF